MENPDFLHPILGGLEGYDQVIVWCRRKVKRKERGSMLESSVIRLSLHRRIVPIVSVKYRISVVIVELLN